MVSVLLTVSKMSLKPLLALTIVLACGSADEILDLHCQQLVDGFNGLQELAQLTFPVDFGSNSALSGSAVVALSSELTASCSSGSRTSTGGKTVDAKVNFETSMIVSQEGSDFRVLQLGPGEVTLHFEIKHGNTGSFVPSMDMNLKSLDLKLTVIEENNEPLTEEQTADIQKVLEDKLLPVAQKGLQFSLADGVRFRTKEDLVAELMLNVYQVNAQNF